MVKHDVFSIIRSGYITINMDYGTVKYSPYWISWLIVLVAFDTCDINSLVKSGPVVSHAAEGSASPSFSFCGRCEETFRSVVLQQGAILGWEGKNGSKNIL